MPEWLVVGLDSGVFWPTTETSVSYSGHQILLRPETEQLAPTVVLAYEPPMTFDDALLLLRQFLSSLAWVEGRHLRETMTTGGSHPIGVGKGPGARLINPHFRVDYLPDPPDPKARLALGLYREALNVNSIAYEFLGFFKIINVIYQGWHDQVAWINRTVDLLDNHSAKSRLAVLKKEGKDIGEYLYVSGRCAVAHAFAEPLVNPEDPSDTRRLTDDLPLIKTLAEYLIEHELGIQSQRTIWQEHLYELEGFRALLGPSVAAYLKNKNEVLLQDIPNFPPVSIRLRDHDHFPAFEKLRPQVLEATAGQLVILCNSADKCVRALLSLNFSEERLEFDPDQGVEIRDDGSSRAVRDQLDRITFIKGLCANAQIEVWDADHESLLGRCDPFIPVNIDLDDTLDNLDRLIKELEAEASRRGLTESQR